MQSFNLNPSEINKDFVIVACILLLPFAFYIYNVAPLTKTWNNLLFEIDSGVFEDVNYLFWILSVKFMTLLILALWFITCTHYWKCLLIVSINIEIYKIYKIYLTVIGLNNGLDSGFVFVEISYFSIPFTLILIYLSKRLKYQNRRVVYDLPLNYEINNHITKLSKFDKKDYKLVKRELKKLEAQKQLINKKEYLTKLITLRDQLTISD
jgi:hypothetical protein